VPKKTWLTLLFQRSLLALWLERYLLVMPSVTALPGPAFGVPEAGPTLAMLGLYLLAYALFARTFPMVSPRLAEVTLGRERGHAVTAAEFDHEEGPKDYVAPELSRKKAGRRESGSSEGSTEPPGCPFFTLDLDRSLSPHLRVHRFNHRRRCRGGTGDG
jgi:hypothetical protein